MNDECIRQYGEKLDKSLYSIDIENKTFSSKEDKLVLDFTGLGGWAFKTGFDCSFNTESHCSFNTGSYCSFNTGPDCTFNTDWNCVFTTGSHCTFNTGPDCIFKTADDCTFKTGWLCTFKTGPDCIFKTGSGCTFDTSSECTFKTGEDCTLICYGDKRYRYFLDKSNYVFTWMSLVEIKDKNMAILNMKHESEYVRNLCKEILKGK